MARGRERSATRNWHFSIALGTNVALMVFFALTAPFLLGRLFGTRYASAEYSAARHWRGDAVLCFNECIGHARTGLGVPNAPGLAMFCGLIAAIVTGPFLVQNYAMLGASLNFMVGTFVALVAITVLTFTHVRKIGAAHS